MFLEHTWRYVIHATASPPRLTADLAPVVSLPAAEFVVDLLAQQGKACEIKIGDRDLLLALARLDQRRGSSLQSSRFITARLALRLHLGRNRIKIANGRVDGN